jgi:hypothetical protein
VTASTDPVGVVAVGTKVALAGDAYAVTVLDDGTQRVRRLRGTWFLSVQLPCGNDWIDVSQTLNGASFTASLEGVYAATYVASFRVGHGQCVDSAAATVTAASRPISAGPNVQVTYDSNPQNDRSESSLASNPLDSKNMVGSSKKFFDPDRYGFFLAAYTTTDTGQSWSEERLLLPEDWEGASDPAVAWGNAGDSYIVALPFRRGKDPQNLAGKRIGIAVYQSTDRGLTWSVPRLIHQSDGGDPSDEDAGDDKQTAAGDGSPRSPFFGNVYAAWDDAIKGRGSLLRFARTTDHGGTWRGVGTDRPGSQVSGVTDSFSPALAVAPDVTVYIAWLAGESIKFVKSTNGGESFSNPQTLATGITPLQAAPLNKPDAFPELPGGTFRVETIPAICAGPGGVVCVAWADYRESVSRIYFGHSRDSGVTWLGPDSGRPLLEGAIASGDRLHDFHPQLAVSPSGDIMCAFYEFGPMPTQNLINVMAAMSDTDGGCFFPTTTVTDRPWDPAEDAPRSHGSRRTTFIGDYFGLAASDRGFFPFWTDTRTGIQEIFSAQLSVSPRTPGCMSLLFPQQMRRWLPFGR